MAPPSAPSSVKTRAVRCVQVSKIYPCIAGGPDFTTSSCPAMAPPPPAAVVDCDFEINFLSHCCKIYALNFSHKMRNDTAARCGATSSGSSEPRLKEESCLRFWVVAAVAAAASQMRILRPTQRKDLKA